MIVVVVVVVGFFFHGHGVWFSYRWSVCVVVYFIAVFFCGSGLYESDDEREVSICRGDTRPSKKSPKRKKKWEIFVINKRISSLLLSILLLRTAFLIFPLASLPVAG